MKSRKGIDKKLDDLWSQAVKIQAGCKCEYCGKIDRLNSHHIYSRSKKSTRWELLNGVCLCVAHHTFSSGFSAHKTPTEFIDWIRKERGEDWYDMLREEANKPKKISISEKEELIRSFKIFIEENGN